MSFSYIVFNEKIELFIDDVLYVVTCDKHNLYNSLKDCLVSDYQDKDVRVKQLLFSDNDMQNMCNELMKNDVIEISNDKVYIDGKEVTNSIGQLISKAAYDPKSVIDTPDILIRFIRKVRQNPNKNIINDICDFICKSYDDGGFAISDEGNILAYKKVRDTYKDIYSNTNYNIPGTSIAMNRDEVCEDRNEVCAPGLHFCSYSYLGQFASSSDNDRIVVVEVDPRDVVSVPVDYDNAKARCCRYKIVGEIDNDTQLEGNVINVDADEQITNKMSNLVEKCNFVLNASECCVDDLIINTFTLADMKELMTFLVEGIMGNEDKSYMNKKISKEKFLNLIYKKCSDANIGILKLLTEYVDSN